MPDVKLNWEFDGSGAWEAQSAATCDGIPRRYLIEVCEDGTFDCSRSDPKLVEHYPTGMKRTKVTFSEAANSCVGCEYLVRDCIANGHLQST